MLDKYPYVQSPAKLSEFLRKLPDIGKPAKINVEKLKSLGYASSNDRTFIPVLKFIRLIDASGVPTALWEEMRANYRVAMGKAARSGYADLFQQYPDANERDEPALRSFFSANTSVGHAAVAKMVSTFKAICSEADMVSSSGHSPTEVGSAKSSNLSSGNVSQPYAPSFTGAVATATVGGVNINIELTVPSDPTGEVYEKFFKAMRKHLLDAN
jgi:hypothetical protein